MPTLVVKTVKPDGTGDYNDMKVAIATEAAARGNLVARDETLRFDLYKGALGPYASFVNITGFTTDATHIVHIRAVEGFTGMWNTAMNRIRVTNDYGLVDNIANLKLENLQIEVTLDGTVNVSRSCVHVGSTIPAGSKLEVINCAGRGIRNSNAGTSSLGFIDGPSVEVVHTRICVNCVAYDTWYAANSAMAFETSAINTTGTFLHYNCTVVRAQGGFRFRANVKNKNCVALYCQDGMNTTADNVANVTNYSTHVESGLPFGGIVSGIFYLPNKPATAVQEGDFAPHPGDPLVRTGGTDLSADADYPFNFDVTGAIRNAPWSAGAWQQSGALAQDVMFVAAGRVTFNSVRIRARMMVAVETPGVYLKVSENLDLSNARTFGPVTARAADQLIATFDVTGLAANTKYYYGINTGGANYDRMIGVSFRTLTYGPSNFMFAASGDADTGSSDPVWDEIAAANPLFFVEIGDHAYENLGVFDLALTRAEYHKVYCNWPQARVWNSMAVSYIWDDHDWGADNANKNAPAGPAHAQVYREYLPSYDLPDSGNLGVWHSFIAGRVRFVVSELRSYRNPNGDVDNAAKTMMGVEQKAWFKAELLAAKAAGQFIIWICPVPWIEAVTAGSDSWGGFSTERRELADFIQANALGPMMLRLSADMHAAIIDDGTNDKFTTDLLGPSIPTAHIAQLEQTGNTKGGPYSGGIPTQGSGGMAGGQYGLITITDPGGTTISYSVAIKRWNNVLLYTLNGNLVNANQPAPVVEQRRRHTLGMRRR